MCQNETNHEDCYKSSTQGAVREPSLKMLAPFPTEVSQHDKTAGSSVATIDEKNKPTVIKWRNDAWSRGRPAYKGCVAALSDIAGECLLVTYDIVVVCVGY